MADLPTAARPRSVTNLGEELIRLARRGATFEPPELWSDLALG